MDQAVARAGPDRAVDAAATVTLDGSQSTPAKQLNFLWEVVQGPEVTFSDAQAQATTFAAPRQGTETRFRMRLKVTYLDYAGRPVPSNSDTDDVIVRVRADPDLIGQEPPPDDNANANNADNANVADNANENTDTTTSGLNDNTATNANVADAATNGL